MKTGKAVEVIHVYYGYMVEKLHIASLPNFVFSNITLVT